MFFSWLNIIFVVLFFNSRLDKVNSDNNGCDLIVSYNGDKFYSYSESLYIYYDSNDSLKIVNNVKKLSIQKGGINDVLEFQKIGNCDFTFIITNEKEDVLIKVLKTEKIKISDLKLRYKNSLKNNYLFCYSLKDEIKELAFTIEFSEW